MTGNAGTRFENGASVAAFLAEQEAAGITIFPLSNVLDGDELIQLMDHERKLLAERVTMKCLGEISLTDFHVGFYTNPSLPGDSE